MSFWATKRVLLTGHTGFKGAWAARCLALEGADVFGLALPPDPGPTLYAMAGSRHIAEEFFVDLRDLDALRAAIGKARPDIVLHMAAQPLVRRSYAEPIETYATNVMGTVHLLECLRGCKDLSVVLCVTSDKVYDNPETGVAFQESDRLGGHDPYSASKGAMEIVVASYARAFFDDRGVAVAAARAGNVIGGGDFSEDRLIPDILRAVQGNTPLVLRYPEATRPWGHVLDCLSGYFGYVTRLYDDPALPRAMNFGPSPDAPTITTGELADTMLAKLQPGTEWQLDQSKNPVEKKLLSLDPQLAMTTLGWASRLAGAGAIEWTADWYRAYLDGADMIVETDRQINAFRELAT